MPQSWQSDNSTRPYKFYFGYLLNTKSGSMLAELKSQPILYFFCLCASLYPLNTQLSNKNQHSKINVQFLILCLITKVLICLVILQGLFSRFSGGIIRIPENNAMMRYIGQCSFNPHGVHRNPKSAVLLLS